MRRSGAQVVVAGTCRAGKSTLAAKLRELGYRAQAVAQEHSDRPLWRSLKGEFLVFLDCAWQTTQERGKAEWGPENHLRQGGRLQDVLKHSDLYLTTDGLTPEEVLRRVLEALPESAQRSGAI